MSISGRDNLALQSYLVTKIIRPESIRPHVRNHRSLIVPFNNPVMVGAELAIKISMYHSCEHSRSISELFDLYYRQIEQVKAASHGSLITTLTPREQLTQWRTQANESGRRRDSTFQMMAENPLGRRNVDLREKSNRGM